MNNWSHLPDPEQEKGEKWFNVMPLALRKQATGEMIEAFCPSADPNRIEEEPTKSAVEKSTELEADIYNSSRTRDAYHYWIAKKVFAINRQAGRIVGGLLGGAIANCVDCPIRHREKREEEQRGGGAIEGEENQERQRNESELDLARRVIASRVAMYLHAHECEKRIVPQCAGINRECIRMECATVKTLLQHRAVCQEPHMECGASCSMVNAVVGHLVRCSYVQWENCRSCTRFANILNPAFNALVESIKERLDRASLSLDM